MGSREFRGQPCPLYGSITYEAMEDNSRYIVNWWSWKFKSRTGTRGAAVRDLLSNSEVAGSVPTRLRWCALLKSSKQNGTAVQCSSQFSASALLINDEFLIKNSNKIPYFLQNSNLIRNHVSAVFDSEVKETRKFWEPIYDQPNWIISFRKLSFVHKNLNSHSVFCYVFPTRCSWIYRSLRLHKPNYQVYPKVY